MSKNERPRDKHDDAAEDIEQEICEARVQFQRVRNLALASNDPTNAHRRTALVAEAIEHLANLTEAFVVERMQKDKP
jgi:hypothetical protein